MSAAEFAVLAALFPRLRNQLWRRRIRRAAVYGVAVGALVLLVAGIVHLSVVAVPVAVWVPLAVAPVVSGAAFALVWQRPGGATAVALFDRHQRHGELFVSALEAYSTPASIRSAGARSVLREAAAKASAMVVSADWASQQYQLRRLPAYTATVWVLAVAGLFLLQLPPPPTATAPAVAVAPGVAEAATTPARLSARQSGAARGRWVPGLDPAGVEKNALVTSAPAAATAPRQDTPAQAVATRQTPATGTIDAAPDRDADASRAAPAAPAGDQPAGGDAASAAGSAPGSAREMAGEDGASVPPDEPFDLAVRTVEVARQVAEHVHQTIAGNGSVAVSASDREEAARGAVPPAAFRRQLPNLPYTTRFSPSQRAQINTYFDSIETLP